MTGMSNTSVSGCGGLRALTAVFVVSVPIAVAGAQELMVTGVLDGTVPQGAPKVVELYALNDIADLSTYALARGGNGGPFETIDADRVLPAIALTAGDFYYAVGSPFRDMTVDFDSVFPGNTDIRVQNFAVNSKGDDVTGLFLDDTGLFAGAETQVDVFGELGVDGTGTAWEHIDGWGYRKNGRGPTVTFDVNDWTFSGPNALDGVGAPGIADSFPDMTYSPDDASLRQFTWNANVSGDWSVSTNWRPNDRPPNAANHHALFGNVITATQTVFTNSHVSVSRINFDAAESYVVAGGGSVNLVAANSPARTAHRHFGRTGIPPVPSPREVAHGYDCRIRREYKVGVQQCCRLDGQYLDQDRCR